MRLVTSYRGVCDACGVNIDLFDNKEQARKDVYAHNAEHGCPGGTDVVLKEIPPRKRLDTIKTLRPHTYLGLKEAKDTTEQLPYTYELSSEEDAMQLAMELEELGCVVEVI